MKPYLETEQVKLYNGHFIEVLSYLIDSDSVFFDLVLVDPPYGLTQAKWDRPIDLIDMWQLTASITHKTTPFLIFGQQPFTTDLIMSNRDNFRYQWIWEKPSGKGHLNAKKRPLSAHEDIVVFYESQPIYNPQMILGQVRKVRKGKKGDSKSYNAESGRVDYDSTARYPRSIINFSSDTQKSALHPNQKPIALIEYLINTYTNPGDIVLDFCAGSCTTGIAAIKTKRKCVLVEQEEKYCEIGKERIEAELLQLPMFTPTTTSVNRKQLYFEV